MTDYKTTIAGVITGIFTLLAAFGVIVPASMNNVEVIGIVAGIGAAVIGFFAKDSKPSA